MAVPGAVTHPEHLDCEDVTFTSGEGVIQAYLAKPQGDGPWPGIIVIHEAFGLVEHIRDVARRFAQLGYVALAPNLYSRVGAPNLADMSAVMATMFSLPDAQVVQDLEYSAVFLRRQPGSNGRVGCIGFCSGGRQTLLYACSSDTVDAACDCWGGFITRATPTERTTPARPVPVLDLVPQLGCPLFAAFGEEDHNPSPTDAQALTQKLKAAGKSGQVKVFSGAGHAFLADYRPTYREQPAFELWSDVVQFFNRHLG